MSFSFLVLFMITCICLTLFIILNIIFSIIDYFQYYFLQFLNIIHYF